MSHREEDELCARLTGIVGQLSAEDFYEQFNLDYTKNVYYSEFFFPEMMQIFAMPGMDWWTPRSSTSLSMVCFNPRLPPNSSRPNPIQKRVQIAHAKVREMLCSSFPGKEDQDAIDVAMANCPTIAIFMCQVVSQPRKKPKNHRKAY